MGPVRLRQFPRRAAGHRHLPPGQSRAPRPDRLDRRRPERRDRRLPGHAGGHRQPHHHGQRHGRSRLGGRRNRGRGGHARPAHLDADSRGRRLRADRTDGRGRDGNRPRAQGRGDAPRQGRGRQVRGVPRIRPRQPAPRRPRHHRQHGARIRRDLRILPRRRRDAALPAPDRPRRGPHRARRGLRQGERAVARGRHRHGLLGHARPRHGRDRPRDLGPAPPAGLRAAERGQGGLPQGDGDVLQASDGQGGADRGRGLRHALRQRGDRLDHLVHQHLEPLRDDRRGTRRPQGGRAGPDPQALGQDVPRAGFAGGLGLSRGGRAAGGSRQNRLQPRRLRLHHLHRQLRADPARAQRGDRRARPRRGLGALGQPQLRGTHLPGRARQLPRLAAARGGLRAGGHHGHRPRHRAGGAGARRHGGASAGSLAEPGGGGRAGREDRHPRSLHLQIRGPVRRRRQVARNPDAGRRDL